MSDDKLSLIKANAGLAKLVSDQSEEILALREHNARLQKAWDSAHLQALENGAAWHLAGEENALLRERVEGLEAACDGMEGSAVLALNQVAALEDENARLREQLSAAEQDARRWNWLVMNLVRFMEWWSAFIPVHKIIERIDAAIAESQS